MRQLGSHHFPGMRTNETQQKRPIRFEHVAAKVAGDKRGRKGGARVGKVAAR